MKKRIIGLLTALLLFLFVQIPGNVRADSTFKTWSGQTLDGLPFYFVVEYTPDGQTLLNSITAYFSLVCSESNDSFVVSFGAYGIYDHPIVDGTFYYEIVLLQQVFIVSGTILTDLATGIAMAEWAVLRKVEAEVCDSAVTWDAFPPEKESKESSVEKTQETEICRVEMYHDLNESIVSCK